MKTMIRAGALALAISATGLANTYGQVSATGNNPPLGSYVGHMGANTNPVEIRHNGNYPIQWFTDSIQRMQLWHSQNSTINGFAGIKQNGYLGISNQPLFFNNGSGPGPFSRLHLADSLNNTLFNYAQPLGFRPWMRNGVTFTGNSDQMYIGHKVETGTDQTAAVIRRQRLRQPRPGAAVYAAVGRGSLPTRAIEGT